MERAELLKFFGKRLRDERVKQGLSQERFAELAGLHRTYIGMVERGEKNVTLENIEKLVKALKLKLSNFFINFPA